MPEKWFVECEFVKIVSIIVAVLSVILVGLLMSGIKDAENILLINSDVG